MIPNGNRECIVIAEKISGAWVTMVSQLNEPLLISHAFSCGVRSWFPLQLGNSAKFSELQAGLVVVSLDYYKT